MNQEIIAAIFNIKEVPARERAEKFINKDVKEFCVALDKFADDIRNDGDRVSPDRSAHLKSLVDGIVRKAEAAMQGVDKKVAREIQKGFRDLRSQYHYASEIVRKGFEKPRGYPGDFEMMNYVYDNVQVSGTRIGQYFDRVFLDNGYACAVRGRKNKMREILEQEIFCSKNGCRILNLPCGPAREIKELLEGAVNDARKVEVVCVDQDQSALDFAKASLPRIKGEFTTDFVKGDILDYIRHPEKHGALLGQFDVIYSIGIADYLPNKVLERLLKFLFGLLKKEGRIYFAYKIHERDTISPLQPKWYCDWDFIPRNISDAEKNFQAIGVTRNRISVVWEETGTIAFLKVEK